MFAHVCRVAELSLEKAHQILKRAIAKSNNKNVQIQCMTSAISNDWQGRVTLTVDGALEGDARALQGCYRLLGDPAQEHFMRMKLSSVLPSVFQLSSPRKYVSTVTTV